MPQACPSRGPEGNAGAVRPSPWWPEPASIDWPAVSAPSPGDRDPASAGLRGRGLRLLALAAALLGLGLAGLALAAWLTEDAPTLPFEYEGFD